MFAKSGRTALTMLLLLGVATAGHALADPGSGDRTRCIVVHDDEGHADTSINLDGNLLTINSSDGDGQSVTVLDLEDLGEIFAAGMADLGDALAELEGLDLDIDLGDESHMTVAYDDSEITIALDEIMEQVSEAMAAASAEIDAERWTETRHRRDQRIGAGDEIADELDDLRAELRELKRELRRLRDRDSH